MRALLIIDIQNDFLPGGGLAVRDGDQTIDVANRLMSDYDVVAATQDWHPAGHGSFASQHPGEEVGNIITLDGISQIMWPDHCVQGTFGAEFAKGLNVDRIPFVVQKGTDRNIDSYSGFFDNGHRKETRLHALLQSQQITEVDIVGLATDYCVKFTALDALSLGYQTRVIRDGVRGVDLTAGDVERALVEMKDSGAVIV
jgi:nicotinamidase/pyrazinamidase